MNDDVPQSQEPSIFDLADPVISRIQIKDITLVGCSVRMLEDRQLLHGATLQHHFGFISATIVEDPLKLSVKLAFALNSSDTPDADENSPVFIEAFFVLDYSLTSIEDLDDNNLKAFSLTNGVYNAWPYWREFVQNLSLRMGLKGIITPVFRFPSQ